MKHTEPVTSGVNLDFDYCGIILSYNNVFTTIAVSPIVRIYLAIKCPVT